LLYWFLKTCFFFNSKFFYVLFYIFYIFFIRLFYLDDIVSNFNSIINWKLIKVLSNHVLNIYLFLIISFILFYTKNSRIFSVHFLTSSYIFLKNYEIAVPVKSCNLMWFIESNLYNGLSFIHPIMVYILYSFIFFITSYSFSLFSALFFVVTCFICIYLSVISMFLGSWWAYQELNWGGWWNWDFVEIILFIFFLRLFLIVHLQNCNWFFLATVKSFFLFYIIIFFMFVRVDIINSIHSFNSWNFLEKFHLYFLTLSFFIIYIYIKISASRGTNFNIYIDKFYSASTIKFINNNNYVINSFSNFFICYLYVNFFFLFLSNFDIIENISTLKYVFNICIYLYSIYILKIKKVYYTFFIFNVYTINYYENFLVFIIIYSIYILKIKMYRGHYTFLFLIYILYINNKLMNSMLSNNVFNEQQRLIFIDYNTSQLYTAIYTEVINTINMFTHTLNSYSYTTTAIVDNLNFFNIKINMIGTNSTTKLSKTNIALIQNIGSIIVTLLLISSLKLRKLKKTLNRF